MTTTFKPRTVKIVTTLTATHYAVDNGDGALDGTIVGRAERLDEAAIRAGFTDFSIRSEVE